MKSAKGELALSFFKQGYSSPYYHAAWPSDKRLLWGTISVVQRGLNLRGKRYQLIAAVNANFIVANTPPGYKVYFGVATDDGNDHWKLKSMLEESGDVYYEKEEPPLKHVMRLGGPPLPVRRLVGSTSKPEIVKVIFDWYMVYWDGAFQFPFVVAKDESSQWTDMMELLMHHTITEQSITTSHCIMWTVWEHGMEIVSDKIPKSDLIEAARKVAEQQALKLRLYND